MYKETKNVNMTGSKKFVANAKEIRFVTTTNEDHSVVLVVRNKCGGGSICQHQKVKSKCWSWHGGSFCAHEKVRYFCRTCDGSHACRHLKQKNWCENCYPLGHLAGVIRDHVYIALKNNKEMSPTEYLGCNIEMFKKQKACWCGLWQWESMGWGQAKKDTWWHRWIV